MSARSPVLWFFRFWFEYLILGQKYFHLTVKKQAPVENPVRVEQSGNGSCFRDGTRIFQSGSSDPHVRFLGGSQNLGEPPLRNSLFFVVMRKSDWQITVILLTKLYCLFFCLKTLTLAFKCFCWSETFAELLWSTWLMWRTSADLWKFCIHLWTHSSFQLFCNLYKSSISHCLSLLFAAIQTLSAICLKTDYVFLPFHGSLPYYRHM